MSTRSRLLLVLSGFLIATWGSMCGIGGGLFAVPLLHYGYRFPLKKAVATSLALVATTTISSTIAELLHVDPRLNWGIVGGMVLGALCGTPLGFRVAQRIDTRRLKMIFVVVLTFVGLRILGLLPGVFGAAGGAAAVENLGWAEYTIAVFIGLGGGFVAPLLGIGGGLVAVPALHLAVPSIGHLGARACSLAMGTVASTRSIMLYLRTGQLNLSVAGLFALGAAGGAWTGVQLVHLEALTDVAEKMLGGTLLAVAVRFAFDVRKPAEQE